MSDLAERPEGGPVGLPVTHIDAMGHVTGTALFTDDMSGRFPGMLHAYPVQVNQAHARVIRMELSAALASPGVVRVLTAADVPGVNDSGVRHDEPLFPSEVMFYGQCVAWVLAESRQQARQAARRVVVEVEPLPAVVTIEEALAAQSFLGGRPVLRRGDPHEALASAAHVFSGRTEIGGQEHIYLETQVAVAVVDESGQVLIHSSTQHPTETQEIAAHVLGLPSHAITVQCLRMGGGFGGKEFQPHGYAAVAALGAVLTGRAVQVRLDRQLDMSMTGKRHPFLAEWTAGFDNEGHVVAVVATMTADGGWSLDLSEPVLARALCHVDNAYFLPHVEVTGQIVQTHKTSQTAFRGFGGPQGMILIEDVMGRCAPQLGWSPEALRRRNMYAEGQCTPYGQLVRHPERMRDIWDQLAQRCAYAERSRQIEEFNASHPHRRRALAMTPQKFGISFNFTPFNQAGALVQVYRDGSVLISHGGCEMGQGLHTKMVQIAASALGVPLTAVRLAPTRTDKVPNTSATAASSGADLNGAAVKDACDQIRERLAPVAARLLAGDDAALVPSASVQFRQGRVSLTGTDHRELSFADVVGQAYLQRVQLWAAGFYRTEGLHWDQNTMTGSPFKYFSYGAACSEVEVDGFTGACRVLRVDILHDVGDSLSPLIDRGQIEGGFIQGMGWMTMERLCWDESDGPGRGRLASAGLSIYKVPSIGDLPEQFTVELVDRATETGVVYGSKAIGEPPLTLAISVREAIRQACAAFGPLGRDQPLALPATPEATFEALSQARRAAVVTC
ncbi:Aldehyde oxidoreductase [Austwickia sp. TVS 96-490-7B]|uniref:xanthine dehydrogenase molybdopterin binding subunit n=1 Tax=Austwickia sp. TVS 96-490-7B TaxID=2830843 RepID=UPI001C5A1B09|nr:xanthine dehydrogenase molybdopterin binding subunit [Austwickia sp. TVS 96-490-7B]MBW3085774.1 Aldehyde oxidoreductase [Austwickia sp. TVS 96-490-7B]